MRELGSSSEHRKLVVTDDAGAQSSVLWWNAGAEEVPADAVDIAYSMRPRSFRGQRTVVLTLIAFRAAEDQSIVLTSDQVDVVDMRDLEEPVLPKECLVWAEGLVPKVGVDRNHLAPAANLAIWTCPPGSAVLRSALSIAKPRTVYLIGRRPDFSETVEDLLARLAGLTKFAINRRDGHARLSELAAALAQRELTVHIGLEWLAASGHLEVATDADGVRMSRGSGSGAATVREELLAGLKSLVQETAAYWAHFQTAEPRSLLPAARRASTDAQGAKRSRSL